MKDNSSLYPLYFEFTLFTDYGPLRYLFFSLCLLAYMTIISANVVIILAVCLEKSLHQLMYIFICCLSCNSLYGSVGFFPRFLTDIVSDTHFISRPACFIQVYIVNTYVGHELTLLTVMAYDRYVAICQPLHYHRKMTLKKVQLLIILSMFYPAAIVSILIHKLNSLSFCGDKLDRIFCTNWPVVQLSCEDTNQSNITGQTITVITIFFTMSSVLYTYLHIKLVCRRSSSEFRGKAFQTCLPHMVTFVNYCISVFCEFSLTRYKHEKTNAFVIVVLSLECLIIPPINNPLVYGLNLPQIRRVIFRHLKFCKVIPALKHETQCPKKTSNKALCL